MKTIVFTSSPDFSDNAFAIFHHMIENDMQYKYIWIVNKKENKEFPEKKSHYFSHELANENIKVVYKKSALGLYYSIFSSYIFFTHGFADFLPHKFLFWQKRYNLWHGMPLKKIGLLNSEIYPKADRTLSTAGIFSQIIAKCFNMPLENIIGIGQPRFDFLFSETDSIREKYHLKNTEEVIVWMPTFRKKTGEFASGTKSDIAGISMGELNNLDKILGKNNKKLIIKLHPLDFLNNLKLESFSQIRIIKALDFQNEGIEVNHFLAVADILITDYSSVYFDYIILKKPVILYENDSEDYSVSRGFTDERIFEIMKKYNYVNDTKAFLDILQKPKIELEVISQTDYNFLNEYVEINDKSFSEQFLQCINLV